MKFLTDEKLTIVGAGGMIGSNMVQSVLMLGLTPNICLYDIYEPGVHGVFDEIQQCAFPGANVTYTVNPEEAFSGAKYIISSGGAPRKEGMTREDLLKGNCKIAAEFGDNIKKYCPDVKHVVVIFNPADVTALYSPVKKILCSLNIRNCFFFLFPISRKRPLHDQSRPFQTMPRCCPIWFELIIRMSLVALQIRFPVACIMFRDPPFVI